MDSHRTIPVGVCFLSFLLAFAPASADEAAPPTLEQIQVARDELAQGWSPAEGLPGASPAIEALVKDPTQGGALPAPAGTATQAFTTATMRTGAIVYLHYTAPLPTNARIALTRAIWGDHKSPMSERPQEVVHFGNTVLVLCFPAESDEGEWFKERLRKKFQAKIPRVWKDLKPMMGQVMGLFQSGDIAQARTMLMTNAERIRDYSYGQLMLATMSGRLKDRPTAEAAFRRAIELHETTDPLPGRESMYWSAKDGLAMTLALQGKLEESIPIYEQAQALAAKLESPESLAKTEYNLACVYAEVGRFEEAHKTLAHCISIKPSAKADARKDSSFEKAREREDFKKLLADGE
mgnify:CR=1 FL=1